MEISGRQFGLLIAYLLPGFIGMAGVAPLSPLVAAWLQGQSLGTAGVGPSPFMLMGAVTLGLIISCFRWLLIDSVLHRTGLRRPVWKDHRLDESLEAFDYLVENHYRYYQFYANTLMAILWSYLVHRAVKSSPLLGHGTDLGVILCAVLFAGARDTLAKYYQRTSRLIGQVAEKDGDVMTNGNHHAQEAGAAHEPQSAKKPASKTEAMTKPEQAKAKPTTSAK